MNVLPSSATDEEYSWLHGSSHTLEGSLWEYVCRSAQLLRPFSRLVPCCRTETEPLICTSPERGSRGSDLGCRASCDVGKSPSMVRHVAWLWWPPGRPARSALRPRRCWRSPRSSTRSIVPVYDWLSSARYRGGGTFEVFIFPHISG